MTEGGDTLIAIRLFVALVAAAALVGLFARRVALPYSVALVVLGLGVTLFVREPGLAVTPELVLSVLLPGLIFEAAYKLDWRELRRSFGGIALLAAPGVLITAGIVAIVLHLSTGLPLGLGFVVGSMVAATDPVAVVSTFRRLRAPLRLQTLLEGESLFNDGTGLVAFAIAVRAVQSDVPALDAIVAFGVTIVLSAILGAIAGEIATRLIASVDDHLIELTISVALAYGTYLTADALHQSGVIATVVAAVILGSRGRAIATSPATQEAMDVVWEFIAFLLTALVFLLVGFAIAASSLVDAAASIAWGIVAILVARLVVVYGLLGGASVLFHRLGHGRRVPVGWLHVLFWGGLRGAVAVAMALSLPLGFPERALLQQITFGIVLFTLLAQGLSVDWLVRTTVEPEDDDASSGLISAVG
jgi:CPA1 family monovalent cation:H+ antiporter